MADAWTPSDRLEELCRDQRDRWTRGERIAVENYFEPYPDLRSDDHLLLDFIYAEYCLREELGDAPDCEEYVQRFPQFTAELRSLFEVHAAVDLSGGQDPLPFGAPDRRPVRRPADSAAGGDRLGSPSTRTLPGYEILEELSRGGMGIVYKARQLGLNRLVAVKMVLAGPEANEEDRARFRGEAEAVARLQHPNIVQIFEIGERAGCPYFVLEFVDGGNLGERLSGTPLPTDEAAALAETLAHAVHFAHEHGVAHRDLKPANILLKQSESTSSKNGDSTLGNQGSETAGVTKSLRRNLLSWPIRSRSVRTGSAADSPRSSVIPKITDWGLAKQLDTDLARTRSGAILGTPSYMAPEQASGHTRRVGAPADIYALGTILYEMLTGRPPFRAATVWETLEQIQSREPVPPRQLQPGLPPDLETICLKCLEKEPAKRYATAAALADDLRRFRAGEPIVARPVNVAERAWRLARRKPLLAGLCAAIAVLLLAVIIVPSVLVVRLDAARRLAIQNEQTATLNQLEAQTNVRKALEQEQEANRQKDAAEKNEANARVQQGRAEHEQQIARRRQYAAQVNLAHAAYEQGHVARAVALLEELRPRFDETDLRGFEWYCLWGQCNADRVKTLRGPYVPVRSIVFSSDGKTLYSAFGDRIARIWDVDSGRQIEQIEEPSPIAALFVSSDDRLLAVGREDGLLQFWRREGNSWRAGTTLRTSGQVRQMALFPNGKFLATADASGRARVWDVGSGKELATLGQRTDGVAVAVAPDGRTVAVGGSWGLPIVTLWKTNGSSWQPHPVSDTMQDIMAMAFAPDGKTIAAATFCRTAVIFDSATAQEIARFRYNGGALNCVAWSPDGITLAFGGSDHSVRIWTPATGEEREKGDVSAVLAVAFSPDGKLLASGNEDGEVKLWPTSSSTLDVSPGGEKRPGVATTTFWDGHVDTFDVQPGGARLVVAGVQTALYQMTPGKPFPGRRIGTLRGGPARFSPDGSRIAVASWDVGGPITIYDSTDAKELRTFNTHTNLGNWSLALSPDGKRLATTAWAGQTLLCDVESGRVLHVLPHNGPGADGTSFSGERRLNPGSVQALGTLGAALAFSPDGRLLAATTTIRELKNFAKVKLWEVATGREIRTLDDTRGRTYCLAFSPDGGTLALGSSAGYVTFRDLRTGEERMALHAHTAAVYAMAYWPDGKSLATTGEDRTVKLWDLVTGQERLTLRGHTDIVSALRFDAQTGDLYSGGWDGIVQRYRPATDGEATACKSELRRGDPSNLLEVTNQALQDRQNDRRRAAAAVAIDRVAARLAKLAKAFPNQSQYISALGDMSRAMGEADFNLGEFDAAESAYRRSVAQFEELLRRDPDALEWRRSLARSLMGLGRTFAAKHNEAEAAAILRRAANIRQEGSVVVQNRTDLEHVDGALAGTGAGRAAIEHWQVESQVQPKDPTPLKMSQASGLLLYGQSLLQKALTAQPDEAAVLLADYRRICARALVNLGGTNEARDAYAVSRTCVLVPDAVVNLPHLVDLAALDLKHSPKQPQLVHNLGLAHLRAGQLEAAIGSARDCLALKSALSPALDWLVLAIAEHRRGHRAPAREWFNQAGDWIANESRHLARDRADKRDRTWVEIQVLYREARAVLAGNESPWAIRLPTDEYRQHLQHAQEALDHAQGDTALSYLELCPQQRRNWEWYRLQLEATSKQKGDPSTTPGTVLINTPAPVWRLKWSPNGRLLAICGGMFSDRKKPQPFLAVWEKATARLAFLKTTFPFSVEDVTWSPDSKSIAVTSSTRADFLEIWDVHSATRTYHFKIDGVRIEWDRSASQLFVGGNDRVDLLNIQTGRQTTVIEAPAAELSLSPDGSRLALSGTSGDLLICNIETPAVKKKLKGHSKRIYCLRWSPDGTRLATTADDQTAKVWNATTGELELDLELLGPAEGVAWTPDGRRLVTAGTLPEANEASEAVIFDAHDGTELYRFPPEYDRGGGSVAWDSGGKTLAISFERNFVKVYDSNGPRTESLKKRE